MVAAVAVEAAVDVEPRRGVADERFALRVEGEAHRVPVRVPAVVAREMGDGEVVGVRAPRAAEERVAAVRDTGTSRASAAASDRACAARVGVVLAQAERQALAGLPLLHRARHIGAARRLMRSRHAAEPARHRREVLIHQRRRE